MRIPFVYIISITIIHFVSVNGTDYIKIRRPLSIGFSARMINLKDEDYVYSAAHDVEWLTM